MGDLARGIRAFRTGTREDNSAETERREGGRTHARLIDSRAEARAPSSGRHALGHPPDARVKAMRALDPCRLGDPAGHGLTGTSAQ
jgi:hypothetical protein